MSHLKTVLLAATLLAGGAGTAQAQENGVTFAPYADARLRYEHVDQPASDADALTLRLRAGAEAKSGKFSLLDDGEGTIAAINDYNAFPFPIVDSQRRPQYSVIADPMNLELNRLQLAYKGDDTSLTLGRQRINLDDQRWVGSVGWRQNEQTFDAVRGEARLGPVSADLTYAIEQRSIFGTDAGPRYGLDGDFILAGLGAGKKRIKGKLFAYLLDYDEPFALANSSQTYGGFLTGEFPIGDDGKLNLRASYARQSDYGDNPADYAADYWSFEAGGGFSIVNVALGFEQLGSDNGVGLKTPLATLHKFNGWADLFLNTPANGLEDRYGRIGFKLDKLVKTMNAQIVYHQFDSHVGGIDYGSEWDASLGAKIGKVGLLAKYARYRADQFAVDTEKLWVQAEFQF